VTVLDTSKWDHEVVDAAEGVLDGMLAARQIFKAYIRQAKPTLGDIEPTTGELVEVYDRLQEQLRVPVIVRPPDEL
jgi:hypothetical protein